MTHRNFIAAILLILLLSACTQAAPTSPEVPTARSQSPAEVLPTDTPFQPTSEPTVTPPDGEAIYFGLRGRMGEGYEDLGVFRYDPSSAKLSQIAPQGWNLQDVSPDGARILINQGGSLFMANYDGSGQKLISDTFFDLGSRGAAWKTDGSKFVFIQSGDHDTSLVSAQLDGSEIVLLTVNGDSPIELEAISTSGDIYWQKGSCSEEGVCRREGVYRWKAADGISELLEGMKRVRLSPDGSQIAYAYDNEAGKSSLGTTGIDLTARVAIPLPGDLLGDFAWSPDGAHIAAVRYDRSDYSGKVSGTRNFLVDPRSGTMKELPESPGLLGGAAFSPDGSRLLLSSSVETPGGFGIEFRLTDLDSNSQFSAAGMSPPESANFLLLTNLFLVGH